MYPKVEKPKENKSRAVANSVVQEKSDVGQGFGFEDNRANEVLQIKDDKDVVQLGGKMSKPAETKSQDDIYDKINTDDRYNQAQDTEVNLSDHNIKGMCLTLAASWLKTVDKDDRVPNVENRTMAAQLQKELEKRLEIKSGVESGKIQEVIAEVEHELLRHLLEAETFDGPTLDLSTLVREWMNEDKLEGAWEKYAKKSDDRSSGRGTIINEGINKFTSNIKTWSQPLNKPGLKLIFNLNTTPGHSIGIYVKSNGKAVLFDANLGVIRMDNFVDYNAMLAEWVTDYYFQRIVTANEQRYMDLDRAGGGDRFTVGIGLDLKVGDITTIVIKSKE